MGCVLLGLFASVHRVLVGRVMIGLVGSRTIVQHECCVVGVLCVVLVWVLGINVPWTDSGTQGFSLRNIDISRNKH